MKRLLSRVVARFRRSCDHNFQVIGLFEADDDLWGVFEECSRCGDVLVRTN